ncbi:hypothetical protein [Achromobacter mucicolens]|uniref:hypothetical protein n=1 Tax=Achromobacter mucicolens TaxID=1389922 RepID=UPI00244A7712|nr:hypothetical protein [Achromobacter mucicolens]MDH1522181.1 hypothetical protein [Achromobacter mucicolens]
MISPGHHHTIAENCDRELLHMAGPEERRQQRQAGIPAKTRPNPPSNPRSNAMLEAIVRFIEELIDVFNFGSSISK